MPFHGREQGDPALMNESLTSVRAARAFEMKSKIIMKNKPSRRISGLLMSFTTISLQPPNLLTLSQYTTQKLTNKN